MLHYTNNLSKSQIDNVIFSFEVSSIPDIDVHELFIRVWACMASASFHRKKSMQDSLALHFVTRGKGLLWVRKHCYEVSEGNLFILYPQTEVNYKAISDEPWQYTWCWLAGNAAHRVLKQMGFDPGSPVISLAGHPEVMETVASLTEKFQMRRCSPFFPAAAAWELMDVLMRAFGKWEFSPLLNNSALAIRNYIENHPLQDVTIQSMAEYFGISRVSIYRKFREAFKLSPKQYIDHMRFERACQLLSHGKMRISEIADVCGYDSPSAFSTAFRNKAGISPSVWHRRN